MPNKTKSNPKILFLNHHAKMGGSEFVLLDIVKHFPGCKVILCEHGDLEEKLIRLNIPVEIKELSETTQAVGRKTTNYWDKLRTFPEILLLSFKIAQIAKNFDYIYANSQKAFIFGCLASYFSRKPLIWHLHDILSTEHFSQSHIELDIKYANRYAKAVIACSEAARQSFIDHGGNPEKIVTIYNDVDAEQFVEMDKIGLNQFKKNLMLNPEKPILGLFGRLTQWKGQHIAINAMKKIPEAQLIIVGSPLFEGSTYFEQLLKLAKRLKVSNRVHFLGQRTDISPIIQICDVILHTSVAPEPFGRVIVEGMIMEKPVIATRGGGTTEIIDNNVNGVLIPMNNPEVLAKAVNQLLRNPDEAKRIARAGYKKALAEFGQGNMIRSIKNLIKRLEGN